MAFAGNDLVNFIGVPMAAKESFFLWQDSGVMPSELSMGKLAAEVETPPYLLLLSGGVMVVTLWFSSKAKSVVKTSVDLSRQDQGDEKFKPNVISRFIVKLSILISDFITSILPASLKAKIDKRYEAPNSYIPKSKVQDMPAFDHVRAAVNLMIASVLISIATSLKLPLSTTYVTFMVAMGTSLADRAWGAESAVYRVAGVLNVIGGWFFTAFSAFSVAAIIATILHFGGFIAVIVLLVFAVGLLLRNYIMHNKKTKVIKEEDSLRRAESSSIQGVIEESADNIANVIKRSNKIYTGAINGLAKHNVDALKKNNKGMSKLSKEIDGLQDNIFYFIKNLDESSVGGASNFYLVMLGYLQDLGKSLEYISKVSYTHANNNHRKLKYNQIKELKLLDNDLEELFGTTSEIFFSRNFQKVGEVLNKKELYLNIVSEKIEKQVARTRTEESSPKNTSLYFSILGESKDMIQATMDLLELYYTEHDSSVEPARISKK